MLVHTVHELGVKYFIINNEWRREPLDEGNPQQQWVDETLDEENPYLETLDEVLRSY